MRAYTREHHIPYVSNWNFNIQQMLTPTLMMEAGYVGSKTTHLTQNRNFNQNDPLLMSLGSALLETVPNPFFGKITSGSLSFPTVERRQLSRPYPQYLQVLIPRDAYGDANYESFQLRVDKQHSHGLTIAAGYTISKFFSNNFESSTGEVGPQNALYNPNSWLYHWKHEDHALEAVEEQALLRRIEGRSYQGDYRTNTGLVQLEAVQENLNHDHRGFFHRGGTVEVEQDFRFGKPRRKPAGASPASGNRKRAARNRGTVFGSRINEAKRASSCAGPGRW